MCVCDFCAVQFFAPQTLGLLWKQDIDFSSCASLLFPPRRLNLADIDRIAPLEEGALPYHLAEVQKQVGFPRDGTVFACFCLCTVHCSVIAAFW